MLPATTPSITLAGLDTAGDLQLTDGRILRLVGIAPRQGATEAARFAEALTPWHGRELLLIRTGEPDRWGRQPARLLVFDEEGASPPQDLASLLIASGAATRLPEAAHAGCGVPHATTLALPALRATPAGKPGTVSAGAIDGHDVAALKAHTGRLVAVEGRVASVGERPYRVYLNFSRRRGEAGAIMISRKLWREMQEAGWTAGRLSGKRIRARGVLSGQEGLLLEIASALALELID